MVASPDTSKAARRRQLEALRAIPSAERLRIADAMSTDVRSLAEAGIRRRHPDASPEQVARLMAELILGRHLAAPGPAPGGGHLPAR
jgi:Rv0078B-related antitoxin